jgi:lysozyme
MDESLLLATKMISKFEGCRLEAYLDSVGIPTIGYGETEGVKLGDKWTQQQADERLARRVKEFLEAVKASCPTLSAPNQIAACTSLAYNIGANAFKASTVSRLIRFGDLKGAANAFLMWNKAGGRVIPGLTNRRQAERAVFLGEQ